MKQWGVWFSWGLMILATLTACAGQPAEVQSTAAVVGEASATLPPTNTPAPTSTSEPTETMTPTHTPVPSPTPEPTSEIALGTIRNNPDTQLTEIYAGNGQYVPTPLEDQFFDPTHLIIEGELMHYRSDGLTVMWSDDLQEWTFPEQFPDEVEKVVPISLMGGKIEISDYQEAWRAHQEIVLNWLNSEFNREFRARVYGSENLLTWDDLVVTNEQGEVRYVVRLHDSVTGEKVWPELGGVTAEMKPIHSNLGDTIDNGENITELDVSSPLLLVAGWKEWQNGVGNFYENSTSGPRNASGVYWAGYGLRFNHAGRLIISAFSTEYYRTPTYNNSESILGGSDGRSFNKDLVEAYIASLINTLHLVDKGYDYLYTIPYTTVPGLGNRVVISGVSEQQGEYPKLCVNPYSLSRSLSVPQSVSPAD